MDGISTGSVSSGDGGVAVDRIRADEDPERVIVKVPVLSLQPGESPRLQGQDRGHVARLAEAGVPLPPILVDRSTMQVIDGMHRLMAASLQGQETVDVEFFDGSPADAFLLAVKANVTHGLPLSLADRRAAAERIIALHPNMSDRAVGESAGLAARTVAAIRRRCADAGSQQQARMGRDGKVRPLNGAEGRRRAAALLAEQPGASLREVAREAGISPATARDVRIRLERGEEPAPAHQTEGGVSGPSAAEQRPVSPQGGALEKLLRDPALRHSEQGRRLLRVLQLSEVGAQEWPGAIAALPPHCAAAVAQLTRQYGQMWLGFSEELEKRVLITDPWSSQRLTGEGSLWPIRERPQLGAAGPGLRPATAPLYRLSTASPNSAWVRTQNRLLTMASRTVAAMAAGSRPASTAARAARRHSAIPGGSCSTGREPYRAGQCRYAS